MNCSNYKGKTPITNTNQNSSSSHRIMSSHSSTDIRLQTSYFGSSTSTNNNLKRKYVHMDSIPKFDLTVDDHVILEDSDDERFTTAAYVGISKG